MRPSSRNSVKRVSNAERTSGDFATGAATGAGRGRVTCGAGSGRGAAGPRADGLATGKGAKIFEAKYAAPHMISRPKMTVERFMGYTFLTMIKGESSSPEPRIQQSGTLP